MIMSDYKSCYVHTLVDLRLFSSVAVIVIIRVWYTAWREIFMGANFSGNSSGCFRINVGGFYFSGMRAICQNC